jgi:hypothetical protein
MRSQSACFTASAGVVLKTQLADANLADEIFAMAITRQDIADRPEKRGFAYPARTVIRYWARQAAFGIAPIRRLFEHPGPDPVSGDAHWSCIMEKEHFATYLGGTIHVDSCNAMTSMMIDYHAPSNPAVLDVGCAGGTMLKSLPPHGRYVGTDISSYAIKIARNDFPNASFIAVDLREFTSADKWDAIIFNEVLYYLKFDEALAQVSRYSTMLSSRGIILVSMKDDAKSRAIFNSIAKQFCCIDSILWQRTRTKPRYSISISRETPATLLCVFGPADRSS